MAPILCMMKCGTKCNVKEKIGEPKWKRIKDDGTRPQRIRSVLHSLARALLSVHGELQGDESIGKLDDEMYRSPGILVISG